MYSIDIMVAEHDNILIFNQAMRNACLGILEGKPVCVEDFENMILFARNYADKHHHGKEEQILFKEMQQHLGEIGTKLINHGMLVEHDLGRLYVSELEIALNEYKETKSIDSKLDIIANAVGYTKLLKRHIDKENEVVYAFAERNLNDEILKDVDERTKIFEEEAKEDIKPFMNILQTLTEKYK